MTPPKPITDFLAEVRGRLTQATQRPDGKYAKWELV